MLVYILLMMGDDSSAAWFMLVDILWWMCGNTSAGLVMLVDILLMMGDVCWYSVDDGW